MSAASNGLPSKLLVPAGLLCVGWIFLPPPTQPNDSTVHLQGSVTKADRSSSWLRERAIDKLPLYNPSGSDARDNNEADMKSWATHIANVSYSKEQRNENPIFDVVMIGSTDRLEYMASKRQSWASSKHFVRDVFMATEITADNGVALNGDAITGDATTHSGSCSDLFHTCSNYMDVATDQDELCSQRRFGLATGAYIRRYQKLTHTLAVTVGKESQNKRNLSGADYVSDWNGFSARILPDYLIVAFDTASYNTTRLHIECFRSVDADTPAVIVSASSWFGGNASYVNNGTRQLSRQTFARSADNFGVVFNQVALEKFSRPVTCFGVNHDPQMEEFEYKLCRWMVSKAKNVFDTYLHKALGETSKAAKGSSKPISISDLFASYSAAMHLICASGEGLPLVEEMLSYLIQQFEISLGNGNLEGQILSDRNAPATIMRCDQLS
jgi:hypothetical protein